MNDVLRLLSARRRASVSRAPAIAATLPLYDGRRSAARWRLPDEPVDQTRYVAAGNGSDSNLPSAVDGLR